MNSGLGKVYLVGAGPGDPGLLTLRGAELLRNADVVFYDALVSEAVLALASASCERVFVGKRGGTHSTAQDEIERLMIEEAQHGKRVVRLKGGDPFVFGRGGEEAQALHAAGVPFEVVPGISSAVAAPAYAGIPLTHREHAAAFTVVTGQEDPSKPGSSLDWDKLADESRTLVLLMATAKLDEIARRLMAHGLGGRVPAAIIANGTRPQQRTVVATLSTIAAAAADAKIEAPAVVVVGEVARLRDELRWFDDDPLFGKRVLITRAGHQSEEFARSLLGRGAQPLVAPTIAIEPPEDDGPAGVAIENLASYRWVVFTSQNGVDAFFLRLARHGGDARSLGGVKVAAIGERTGQRLLAHGVTADLTPAEFVSEALARELLARTEPGDRVLIYRAADARDVLPQQLEKARRHATVVAAYRTVVPHDAAFARTVAEADVLTFTSASTVRGFATLLGERSAAEAARGKCVACIGPITAAAARDAGLNVNVVAGEYTVAGLLAALASHLRARG